MTGARHSAGWRAFLVGLAALAVVALGGLGLGGTPASAAPVRSAAGPLAGDETTTTVPTTTTTTEPPVTTTTVPTTTTTTEPPVTTTSRPAETTTTVPATTTTTLAPGTKTSSSTPWALIIVIVVLVLAIVAVALLLRSRKRKAVEAGWRHAVVPALSDAQLARESLHSASAQSDDPQLRGAVEVQVEKAATALERSVPSAPDPDAGALGSTAAGALRGLAFAIEADRLLRHGSAAPSGVQLAQADEARRARAHELDTALARLATRIGSAPGSSKGR